MDREPQQTFISRAGSKLASVRNSLVVLAQSGEADNICAIRRGLAELGSLDQTEISNDLKGRLAECEAALAVYSPDDPPAAIYRVLDKVAAIEAELLDTPLHSDEFVDDLSGLIDSSFDDLIQPLEKADENLSAYAEFEIDDETLEIFRAEAAELIAAMAENIEILASSHVDKSSLWEVRRCAHTFKGAAGIVGYMEACRIAHHMEDLLDKVVEKAAGATNEVIVFLRMAAEALDANIHEKEIEDKHAQLEGLYDTAIASLDSLEASVPASTGQASVVSIPAVNERGDLSRRIATPVVRVSLDRLDELVRISRDLVTSRTALSARLSELIGKNGDDTKARNDIANLLDSTEKMALEIQNGLLKIRMVKFGTLETRLSRAVHATCLDENKKAGLTVLNGEVEIDTLVIDMLIEPLLHLIKNAVVHGIESAETRRMIGKPERGNITVGIEADDEALVLTVADDGGGISISKLLNKAIDSGVVSGSEAAEMDERTATRLIFSPGLTTAEKIDLNAGRGVGMAIVKESIENRGGTVLVDSRPQQGTTFTILMPLAQSAQPTAPDSPAMSDHPQAGAGPLVLIVDDSATVRNQVLMMVEEAGVRGITANNGAEALELLLSSKWEPDLIVSDVEMPQIDGWQFLEYVKTDENFGSIPVVMVTSLDAAEDRQRALDLGASGYLNKPIDRTRIDILIKEYCTPPAA